jgi:uncharacterized protein YecE (DUF72 family)
LLPAEIRVSAEEQHLYGSFRPTEQVALAWERTREIADVPDAQVIVVQCPKSFLPAGENTRNLSGFFQEINRRGRRLAWEPRGEEWAPELIRDLCAPNDLIHCVDTGCRYRYTEDDLAELEAKLHANSHLPGPKYLLFNNIYSREDATRFLQR